MSALRVSAFGFVAPIWFIGFSSYRVHKKYRILIEYYRIYIEFRFYIL